ncbi:hypothetical protein B6S44_15020 [Bosea sp. Tri-44]|uniref:DUF768 domain-containing protein n=1 Tax=Bosea sp. Tri-44 TaxID=1972137 RepID=UPI00100E8884|nr:DUF768 domain-containing protein [Bosea sp. Tri-44]RXT54365.1 hypothetical protein B6S44_15020 [Bosea sp. Tri-44]
MSTRAIAYVEQWIAERVKPDVYHDEEGPDERNMHLATQLLLDANSAGIPQEEIEAEYPDLPGEIPRAMAVATNNEITRRVDNDDLQYLQALMGRNQIRCPTDLRGRRQFGAYSIVVVAEQEKCSDPTCRPATIL